MPRIHASRKSRRQRIIFAIDCQDAFFSSLLVDGSGYLL
jgi:hypothetical protein